MIRLLQPLRSARLVLALALFACAPGCRHSSNDKVESVLRMREAELRRAREDLCRTEAYNEALQREIGAVRTSSPSTPITPEQAAQSFTLKKITLGRQTGGFDDDDGAGDEALQIVLEPRDGDNHAIKAPGNVEVVALEISPEGLKRPLSQWQVPQELLRSTWKSGLFSTGYYIHLPWKVWPSTDKLRLVVKLTLTDGRSFEADKDVTIKLVPQAQRRPMSPADAPIIEAPMPRKLDGSPLPTPTPMPPLMPNPPPAMILAPVRNR